MSQSYPEVRIAEPLTDLTDTSHSGTLEEMSTRGDSEPTAPLRAAALIRTADGAEHALLHGDFIGRLTTATLHIPDPRVSEAHALVSLRGADLKLLALRGVFAIDGRRRAEVALKAGLRVELADGLFLDVIQVELPGAVLGLEGQGLARQVLPGACSLVRDPRPSLQAGYVVSSVARIWNDADGWWVARVDTEPTPFVAGSTIEVDGKVFTAVAIPLHQAGSMTTRQGSLARTLTIIANFDTVHIHPDGLPPVILNGVLARLVSELVALDGPASWHVVAELVWPGALDRNQLRRRLDVGLFRLRAKLREGGVRPDLVKPDGTGGLELIIGPDDRVEDRT